MFEELKVLELASVLAGPAVGMFFSELGAKVVKIENKAAGGDLTRKWKLPVEDENAASSAYYHSVNWGKEVLFLDLNDKSDAAVAHQRIAESDILITNFKAGDADKFGMNASLLLQRYPTLILAEVIGFDEEDRVAYDAVLQAESGFMSINGEINAPPLKLPVAFIDLMTAHQLKEGILIALMQRMKTGKGACVTASLYRSAIASLANQAGAFLNTGTVPRALGSLHPTIAPYGETAVCADGQRVLLAVGTDEQFVRLMRVLGALDLSNNPLFASNELRVVNRQLLAEKLTALISSWPSSDFLNACHHVKVPAAAVLTLDKVFENKVAQSMILEQKEDDGFISKRVATVAFKIDVYA